MKSQILNAKNAKGGNMKAYTIADYSNGKPKPSQVRNLGYWVTLATLLGMTDFSDAEIDSLADLQVGDRLTLDAGALSAGEARAEAVSIIRNTMTRLLELLDAGIPIEGWTMFANFAVRRVAGVIDDMQFSTAIARTYYRNILQQLEQSEA